MLVAHTRRVALGDSLICRTLADGLTQRWCTGVPAKQGGTCKEATNQRCRDTIREDVWHRKPEVARDRLTREYWGKGYRFFAMWLNQPDRIFRQSVHYESFFMRWFRASTSDGLYDFRSWHRVQSPYRYISICLTRLGWLRSDLVRRLSFPDLALVVCTSTSLSFYNVNFAAVPLVLPSELFMITSMAVGLLVTFRTQMSYGRYDRAVELVSSARAEVRELHSRILARVPQDRGVSKAHAIWRKRDHGAKLAQSFMHVLKYHVTLTGQNANFGFISNMSDEELQQKKAGYLRDELALIWDFNDCEEMAIVDRLLDTETKNRPMHVCQELTHLNATQYCVPNPGGLAPPSSEGVDSTIRSLQNIIANCERIIQTPIYSPYTVFTSRVIFLWVNVMSLGIYPLVGPIGTPIVSLSIGFLVLGIDHIGMRVEQPFHMLPLWQLVELTDKDCEQMRRNDDARSSCEK